MNINQRGAEDDLSPGNFVSRRSVLAILGTIGLRVGEARGESERASIFRTTHALMSAVVPLTMTRIVTGGFAVPEDGGAATWHRVPQQPKHPGYITDAGGAFFEIDEKVLLPEMFGARGGDHDDYISIQQAVSTATLTKRRLEFRGARYSIGSEIVVPAGAEKFSLAGVNMTDLIQLQDNKSVFLFSGENTHHWSITGFRFSWRRNQSSARRNSYAVRFETDRHGGAGHWGFEISDCILVNGFRGFGQSDDGRSKHVCPIWGGVFRRIHSGMLQSGAAIFLNTFGKSGQPNNRIENFYARGDNRSEPAIIIGSSDTTILTSIEFNRGSGCQLFIESSSNIVIHGIRLEHVALKDKDAYIVASGGQTNLQLFGLSVQSMEIAPRRGSTLAVIRALNGARVRVDGFTDMPWRAPSIARDESVFNTVAVADAHGGDITAGFIAPLFDPALTLARVSSGSAVRFSDADNYDFVFEGKGKPLFARKLVRQRAGIVAIAFFVDGIGEDILREVVVCCDGKPILHCSQDLGPKFAFGEIVILPGALKSQESRFKLKPGSILSIILPEFDSPSERYAAMVSLVAIGV